MAQVPSYVRIVVGSDSDGTGYGTVVCVHDFSDRDRGSTDLH